MRNRGDSSMTMLEQTHEMGFAKQVADRVILWQMSPEDSPTGRIANPMSHVHVNSVTNHSLEVSMSRKFAAYFWRAVLAGAVDAC